MIGLKAFKKTVAECLFTKGFSKHGAYYCLISEEVITVIGFQKSNYSNAYYINLGYVISGLNPVLLTPRDVDGDIRARFSVVSNGKEIDVYELDRISESDLVESIKENMERYSNVTTIKSLKGLLDKNPVLLYQTKMNAKKYLGID